MARHLVATSQQYLQRAGVPVSTPPLTLAAWVKSSTPTQNGSPIATLCHTTINTWWFLGMNATTARPQAQAYDGTTAAIATAVSAAAADTWTHVCAVFSSLSAQACYIGGASKGTATTAVVQPTLNYTVVGALFFNSGLYSASWDGDVAEVALWNAALSDAEVAQLATGGTGGIGLAATLVRPGNLVAYYPLLGTTSPEPDVIGGTGLTLINAPTAATHPPIQGASAAGGRMFAVF